MPYQQVDPRGQRFVRSYRLLLWKPSRKFQSLAGGASPNSPGLTALHCQVWSTSSQIVQCCFLQEKCYSFLTTWRTSSLFKSVSRFNRVMPFAEFHFTSINMFKNKFKYLKYWNKIKYYLKYYKICTHRNKTYLKKYFEVLFNSKYKKVSTWKYFNFLEIKGRKTTLGLSILVKYKYKKT